MPPETGIVEVLPLDDAVELLLVIVVAAEPDEDVAPVPDEELDPADDAEPPDDDGDEPLPEPDEVLGGK